MPKHGEAILELAAAGMSYRSIAEALGLHENTVKQKAVKIEAYLGADNITQAVAMAIRRRIIA